MKNGESNKINRNDEGMTKKQRSITANKVLLIFLSVICIVLAISIIVVWYTPEELPPILKNTRRIKYKGKMNYIITGDYEGEHQIATYLISKNDPDKPKDIQKVLSYSEYVEFCKERNIDVEFTDESKYYAVFSYSEQDMATPRLAAVNPLGKYIYLYVWDDTARYQLGTMTRGYAIVVPTNDYRKNHTIEIVPMYTEYEFDEMTSLIPASIRRLFNQGEQLSAKPVIYLYPTEDTKVDVHLVNKDLLTCTYPKYEDKWSVLAKPNGDLTYLSTGRSLYSLYYEANNIVEYKVTDEGFVIKGEDSATFLEEKLAILGLNAHEAEEFIIYWLPKLEANEYNYIRFATKEEINSNMPLEVNPNPDSIIRVLMTYKGLKTPFSVKEQVLETPNRDGFVLVEWGGTEIK